MWSGKYQPAGTNVLLCTIVGNNWERVVTLTDEQVYNVNGGDGDAFVVDVHVHLCLTVLHLKAQKKFTKNSSPDSFYGQKM